MSVSWSFVGMFASVHLYSLFSSFFSTLDTPNREEVFVKRAADFKQHAGKMSDTATALAKSGIVTDRKLADDLISTAGKVKALAPQVAHAARIVLDNPDNEAAKDHYKLVREDYQRQVQKLTDLVDSGVDPVDFIAASEEQLKADLEAAKVITKAGSDPQGAFNHVASAARTANRVVAVTQGEVENTEDLEFKRNLVASSEAVKQSEGL